MEWFTLIREIFVVVVVVEVQSVYRLATGWMAKGSEFEAQWGQEFSPHPDWLWGPSNLLSNGYWELFPRG
jgi:hypothetical protein